jgi:hypothetical protein
MLLAGRHEAWQFSPPARTARPRGRPPQWPADAMVALCDRFTEYARHRRHNLPAEAIYRALVRDVYAGLRPSTLRRRHSEAKRWAQK